LRRHASGNNAEKEPLQWTGVLFALATNVLLVTLIDSAGVQFDLGRARFVLPGIVAPLFSGVLTALYTGQRGAMHAFLGGLLSIPVIGWFVLTGAWQLAIFAGSFCTLGGAVAEIVLRRRKVEG
jgi:hypothetical protein